MLEIEICVDVPDLARGVRFYEDAFGFSKVSEPYRGVAVLAAGSAKLTLLEKRAGTKASPNSRPDINIFSMGDATQAAGAPAVTFPQA